MKYMVETPIFLLKNLEFYIFMLELVFKVAAVDNIEQLPSDVREI